MARAISVVLLAAIALAGCGGGHQTRSSTSALARAQRTHEYPAARSTPQHSSDPSLGAVAAVRAFATAYINWSAATVSADMRALAARSVGQARSAMQLAAVNTAQDYELRRGGIANSGVVEAIAQLRHSRTRYVVVTLERTTAADTNAYQGLRPAWHVAIANVTQVAPGRWALSGWQPES